MCTYLSIIIPIYNAEHTIARCINSICFPAEENIEIILIDDGSTDKSFNLCQTLAQTNKNIKLIHKVNGGVSSARNSGIEAASGEWITFIDSDDLIINSLDVFREVKGIAQDLAIYQYHRLESNGILNSEACPTTHCRNKQECKQFISQNLTHLLFRSPWGKFFKRNIIGDLRFDTTLRIGEDTDFVFRYLAKCSSIIVMDKYYYIWTTNDTNIEDKYSLHVTESIDHLNKINAAYQLLNISSFETEIFFYRFYKSLCNNDIKRRPNLWYGNKDIWLMWKRIKKHFPVKQHIKHSILHLISTSLNPIFMFNIKRQHEATSAQH